jgi:hypothetical protein
MQVVPREHAGMKRALPVVSLVLVLLAYVGASRAGTASTSLTIAVRILHFSKIQVLSQPPDFEVTEQHIASGYVDVPLPMVVSVATNSPTFTIVLTKAGGHVQRVQVEGLAERVRFTSDSAVVWQATSMAETLRLRVRFELAPGLTPGKYPWALLVSSLAL